LITSSTCLKLDKFRRNLRLFAAFERWLPSFVQWKCQLDAEVGIGVSRNGYGYWFSFFIFKYEHRNISPSTHYLWGLSYAVALIFSCGKTLEKRWKIFGNPSTVFRLQGSLTSFVFPSSRFRSNLIEINWKTSVTYFVSQIWMCSYTFLPADLYLPSFNRLIGINNKKLPWEWVPISVLAIINRTIPEPRKL
jgi:hypothetical protein